MSGSPAAESLLRAQKEKLTGILQLSAGGRESKLFWEGGDLVGADLRFGYQSLPQSLLAAGRIAPRELDALWARGEANHLEHETMEQMNLDVRRSWEIQLFAILRCICRTADAAQFTAGPPETMFERVLGDRLVLAVLGGKEEIEPVGSSATSWADLLKPGGSAQVSPSLRLVVAEAASPVNDTPVANGNTGSAGISEVEEEWLDVEGDLEDSSDPLEQARRRRQRLVKRGMENLGAIATNRPVAEAPPPQPVAPAAAPEPSKRAPPSSDEKQLADAIEKRFRELEPPKDYFAVLEVPRSAGADEIKASFLQLAKVFHPDRLPSSLQRLAAKITAIFEAVREAYETLQVDSKRKSYLASLESAAPKPAQSKAEPSIEASDAFKRGDLLMKKKDFAAAEQEYLRAYGFDPKPLYRASQAWAIYLDPARKGEAANAKQMMAEALRADPACDRAHYQLGVICRVEGAKDKAEKHFREALRANPKHLDASQELRIIEMRKKKGLFR